MWHMAEISLRYIGPDINNSLQTLNTDIMLQPSRWPLGKSRVLNKRGIIETSK